MKKAYKYDIRVGLNIPQLKQTVYLDVTNRTNITELRGMLAEFLNLQSYTTNIDFYTPNSNKPLNYCSTLEQNQIRNGGLIIANL